MSKELITAQMNVKDNIIGVMKVGNNESYQNKIEWSVRRELAKTNYRIHTDSILEKLNAIAKKQYNIL